MKANILSTALANATYEVCTALYNETGVSAVCDYANKIGLRYGRCTACDAEMPAIQSPTFCICGCCGSEIIFMDKKSIKKKYKNVTTHLNLLQISEDAILDSIVIFLKGEIAFYDNLGTVNEIIVHGDVFKKVIAEYAEKTGISEGTRTKVISQAKELNTLCENYDYIHIIDRK